jgi:2-keto-4-pentenoate hydratase/2-oxohepta-3-ene-1,7-dioic acid hydratase in catechol pathway
MGQAHVTGVGASMSPPQYLVPGTEMEVNIAKIGTFRNGVEFA